MQTPKTFKHVLEESGFAQKAKQPVIQAVQELQQLSDQVRAYLPTEMKSRCSVLKYDPPTLVLCVPSPIWANRLRFLQYELQAALQTNTTAWSQLKHIQIRVIGDTQPKAYDPTAPHAASGEKPQAIKRRMLDEQSAQLLAETAHAMDDSPLKKALQKLAQRGQQQDES